MGTIVEGYGYIVALGGSEDVGDWCDKLIELGYLTDGRYTDDAAELAYFLKDGKGWDVFTGVVDGTWKAYSDGSEIPFMEGIHENVLFFNTGDDFIADDEVAEMFAEMQRLEGQSGSYDLRHYYEFVEI